MTYRELSKQIGNTTPQLSRALVSKEVAEKINKIFKKHNLPYYAKPNSDNYKYVDLYTLEGYEFCWVRIFTKLADNRPRGVGMYDIKRIQYSCFHYYKVGSGANMTMDTEYGLDNDLEIAANVEIKRHQ